MYIYKYIYIYMYLYIYIYILSRVTHNQQNLCASDAQPSCVSRGRQ